MKYKLYNIIIGNNIFVCFLLKKNLIYQLEVLYEIVLIFRFFFPVSINTLLIAMFHKELCRCKVFIEVLWAIMYTLAKANYGRHFH